MSNTPFEEFLPEVLPYVQNCPEIVAINAIRNSCIEFCDRSGWWLYEVAATGEDSFYDLVIPDYTTVARIHQAWFNDVYLYPASEDQLQHDYGLDWRGVTGAPRYYTQLADDEVVLAPSPADDNSTFKLIVALRPTRDSIDVDSAVYNNWAEQIALGARARLHEISAQPFYDMAAAMACRMQFNIAIGRALRERIQGMVRPNQTVRPPRFV